MTTPVLRRGARLARLLQARGSSAWHAGRRWRRIYTARAAPSTELRVYYGHDHVPSSTERVSGGAVKFQRLQEALPNATRDFNVLYVGSSTRPPDLRQLIWLARRRRAPLVWNQNGVAYPGWAGDNTNEINAPLALGLHAADHVFYQSEFCKLGADRWLGERAGPSEILYNCVDTRSFTPGERALGGPLMLLLGGNQYEHYRLDVALQTVARLVREGHDVQLRVTGRLNWLPDDVEARRIAASRVSELGIAERVEFSGPYTQVEAPGVLRAADVLLHTKYNDPCPGLVVEAMACGLPIVHSASGGLPELVGEDAGVGVSAPLDWEHQHPPDPAALADAVLKVAIQLDDYREAARRRAVERFDIQPWLERHVEVFRELLA